MHTWIGELAPTLIEETTMPASTTYSDDMIAEMKAQSPLNHAKAKALAGRGLFATRSIKSIIAKAKSEGIEYVAAARPAKATTPKLTKADLVASITQSLDADSGSLDGLRGATTAALTALMANIA